MMMARDRISRSTFNGHIFDTPKDIYAAAGVRVVFSDAHEIVGVSLTSAYNHDNAFAMRFVPDDDTSSAAAVRVQQKVPDNDGEWTDVAQWVDGEHDYVLLVGRHYRVVSEEDVVFEVCPPRTADVTEVICRSVKSFDVRLHKMLLGQE